MDLFSIGKSLTQTNVTSDQLLLDIKNPRFVGEDITISKKASPTDPIIQERIRKFIIRKFNGQDLVESISQVGFLKMDRMVVTKYGENQFIVIEGNRRTAAIKTALKAHEEKEYILPDGILDSLNNIEVLLLDCDKEDITYATWFLQGVRHISGIKNWGPYQQAELVNTLMQQENMNFTEAGKAIGAGRKRAAQMYRAYRGLKQMEKDDEFSEYAHADLFSHFEQAYIKHPVRDWLDWDEGELRYRNKNNLKHFYRWITSGNDHDKQEKLKAVDVRGLLPAVVKNKDARTAFLNGDVTLETANGMALVSEGEYSDWHPAIKSAISQINKIPWAYELTDNDDKLLSDLVKTIEKFKESRAK